MCLSRPACWRVARRLPAGLHGLLPCNCEICPRVSCCCGLRLRPASCFSWRSVEPSHCSAFWRWRRASRESCRARSVPPVRSLHPREPQSSSECREAAARDAGGAFSLHPSRRNSSVSFLTALPPSAPVSAWYPRETVVRSDFPRDSRGREIAGFGAGRRILLPGSRSRKNSGKEQARVHRQVA